MVTDLNVTGKAAQFGGGVMKDVSNRMLAQFADNLSQLIQSGAGRRPPTCGRPPGGDHAGASARPTAFTLPATTASTRWACSSAPTPSSASGQSCRAAGLLVGYLYGKNRTLERMVRRA